MTSVAHLYEVRYCTLTYPFSLSNMARRRCSLSIFDKWISDTRPQGYTDLQSLVLTEYGQRWTAQFKA